MRGPRQPTGLYLVTNNMTIQGTGESRRVASALLTKPITATCQTNNCRVGLAR